MLDLINNRTERDLKTAKELLKTPWRRMSEAQKAAYNAGLTGIYSPADYNRVEAAVVYLARRLRELPEELGELAAEQGTDWRPTDLPYDPAAFELTTKTDWAPADMFPTTERERYISNVRVIRDAMAPDMPLPSTLDGLTLQGANDIEAALMAAEANFEALRERYIAEIGGEIAKLKIHSGEVFSGEVTA